MRAKAKLVPAAEVLHSPKLKQGGQSWRREAGRESPALLLQAAKPLVWRGPGGELPQLPWECCRQGLYLVIDLWSGLGGFLVALLALGFRCIALAAEEDEALSKAVQSCFRQ